MNSTDYYSKPIKDKKNIKTEWRRHFPDYEFPEDCWKIVYKVPRFEDGYRRPMKISCPKDKKMRAVILDEYGKWYFLGYWTDEWEVSEFQYLHPHAKATWRPSFQPISKTIPLVSLLKYANSRIQKYRNILDKKQVVPSTYEDFEFERYVLFHMCTHFNEGLREFIFLEKKLFQSIRTAELKKNMDVLCNIQKGVSVESYIEDIYTKNVPNQSFTFEEAALGFLNKYLNCVPHQLVNIARALGYI